MIFRVRLAGKNRSVTFSSIISVFSGASSAQRGQSTLIVESKDKRESNMNDDDDDDNFLIQEEKPSTSKSLVKTRESFDQDKNDSFRNSMISMLVTVERPIKMMLMMDNMEVSFKKCSMQKKWAKMEVKSLVNDLKRFEFEEKKRHLNECELFLVVI